MQSWAAAQLLSRKPGTRVSADLRRRSLGRGTAICEVMAVAIERFGTAVTVVHVVDQTGRWHRPELGPADAGEGSGYGLAELRGAQSQALLRLGLAGVFLPKSLVLRVVSLRLPPQLHKEPCNEKWGRLPNLRSPPQAQRCKITGCAAC